MIYPFTRIGSHFLPFGNVTSKEKETLCYQFMGAMLLPEQTIKAELGEHRNKLSINKVRKYKKQYGISMRSNRYESQRLWYNQ